MNEIHRRTFRFLEAFLPFPFFVAPRKSDSLFSCFPAFPALSHFDNSAIFAFFWLFSSANQTESIHHTCLACGKWLLLNGGNLQRNLKQKRPKKKGMARIWRLLMNGGMVHKKPTSRGTVLGPSDTIEAPDLPPGIFYDPRRTKKSQKVKKSIPICNPLLSSNHSPSLSLTHHTHSTH